MTKDIGKSTSRKAGDLLKILKTTKMEDIVGSLISRPDGLSHLLMSDVDTLMADIQTDFPDLAKVYSIGKSTSGRDINVLELSYDGKASKSGAPKETTMVDLQGDSAAESAGKPAILMTGATHARELISTT